MLRHQICLLDELEVFVDRMDVARVVSCDLMEVDGCGAEPRRFMQIHGCCVCEWPVA